MVSQEGDDFEISFLWIKCQKQHPLKPQHSNRSGLGLVTNYVVDVAEELTCIS